MVTRTKSLAREVAELRKLVEERVGNTGPVYLRDGDAIPQKVDPERVVWIKRTFIDPPERPEEPLPAQEAAPADEQSARREPISIPELASHEGSWVANRVASRANALMQKSRTAVHLTVSQVRS